MASIANPPRPAAVLQNNATSREIQKNHEEGRIPTKKQAKLPNNSPSVSSG
jgi:hypothetical protein